jgi:hypothetical protein
MLSDIQHHWPPSFPDASGGEVVDPHVGHRSTVGQIVGQQREPLYELHEGAWWTGCRFAVPSEEPSRTIRCTIAMNSGSEIFHSWTQETGEWHPLPWPIPAAFAREYGLVLFVELAETVNPPVFLARRIAFQELPDMPRDQRYLFVDGDDGYLRAAWNGIQGVFARRSEDGESAQWNASHILVPPMDYLATGRPWSIDRTHSPDEWSTNANLDGAPA